MVSGKGRLIGDGVNLAVSYALTVQQSESGPSIAGFLAFSDHQQAPAAVECRNLVLHLGNGRKLRGLCTNLARDFQGAGDFF